MATPPNCGVSVSCGGPIMRPAHDIEERNVAIDAMVESCDANSSISLKRICVRRCISVARRSARSAANILSVRKLSRMTLLVEWILRLRIPPNVRWM